MRDMSPEEAAQRWIDKRRDDLREASLSTLHYRTKEFVEWCAENDIESMAELTPWDIDDFEADRRAEISTISMNNQLGTVQDWLEWCASRGLVDENVAEAVDPPTVTKEEQSSDIKLDAEDAIPQIRWYRQSSEYGSRKHVVLELMWHIGCRLGAVRGLDLRDYVADAESEEYYLDFRHRPESGTPLKNGSDGERPVGLRPTVADVVETYIDENRKERRDDFGRDPLLTTQYGRISKNSVRMAAYFGTAPCWRTTCPHDREDRNCEWWHNNGIAKCPSTRSPHQIRTGSITWQLNQGIPMEVVAKRANVSPEILRRHYDKSDPLEELRQRRQPHLEKLDIPTEDTKS
ncbi:site-specific integrase [Natronomonas halophila]|uniref:tyrosine-type recombinase/integrase n=1 Tax=Natronomonas halophila TaxID=2747817 RepID=UPI0015B6A376|nr:site-specific integrase [Natronomonas halophila]QLD84585.1 site-specific integrase [Natronomonas halophila]QLD84641.1 site-specific integrase [Natronomonas halophila]